jgi:hypothetical protein
MTAPTTCAVCHTRLIFIGSDTHPACEPGMAGEFHVDWPTTAKQAVLKAVKDAAPELVARGVEIVRAAALRHQYVSANLTRDALTAAGIQGPRVGAVYNAAAKAGHIERDGFIPSDQGATHGHHIARWRSRVYQGREVA